MTDEVMFAPGWNNPLTMLPIPHQPTAPMPGLLYARQADVISGLRFDDAPYTKLTYPRIYVSWFDDNNAFYGIGSIAGSRAVKGTFHLKYDNTNWYNFNGIIKYIVNGNPTTRTFNSWSQVEWKIVGLVKI